MKRTLLYTLFIFFFSAKNIDTVAQCNAAFNYTVSSNTATFNATTNSQGYNHVWRFGDGGSGNGATITHNYNQPGQYLVKHIITDSLNNCVDSASQSITISFTPFCTSSFLSNNFFPALNKFVFASTSFVAGTAIKNYTWKINNIVVDTNDFFVYTFPSAGTYNVCLKIETYSGCISEHCEQVQVFGYCNKNSSFTTSANPQQPGTLTFTPNPDNPQFTYWWHPDNGLGYNQRKPTISLQPGSHNVRLTIIDSLNHCYDTVRQVVNIQATSADSCTASFTYTLNNLGQANFTAVSNQTITSQVWTIFNFSDSNSTATINSLNPAYNFNDTGYYWVCVKITTNTGCIRSYCQGISVNTVTGRMYTNRIPSYPNPATSNVMLNLKMEKEGMILIKVFNLSGNIVYGLQQYGNVGNNKLLLPVQNFAKGQYIIDIKYNDEKRYSVFQKQ
jgi:hypothetical protein